MKRKKKQRKRALPKTSTEWLAEIANAFIDAREAMPFAAALGAPSKEADLFHLAPDVALKFRGLPTSKKKVAMDAAFSSYVASKDKGEQSLNDPILAFGRTPRPAHRRRRMRSPGCRRPRRAASRRRRSTAAPAARWRWHGGGTTRRRRGSADPDRR